MNEVFIPIGIVQIQEKEEIPTKTYKMDFETGRIIGTVDGIQAITQAIIKAFKTPRFKCLIYDGDYGCELQDVIKDEEASESYISTVGEELLRDATSTDDRVISVSNFKASFEGDEVYISSTIETIFGTVELREVIKVV